MGIQEKINEIIASRSDDNWNRWSRIYLNNASGSVGKTIERDTLTKMATNSVDGSDSAVIQAIATNEINNTTSDNNKRIKLFLLQHRSQYNPGANEEYLKGSYEYTATSSQDYINRAISCGLGAVSDPSRDNLGYEVIATDGTASIYQLAEYNKLYGREQPLGFATSISSAACVYNGITNQIIPYTGYFFEGGGSIPNITGNSTVRNLSYIIYTPGGGPLSEHNWIIKVVETSYSNFIGADEYSSYIYPVRESAWIIKKIYIHFFKYNGTYVRRAIDRTNMAKQSGFNNLDIWNYKDYVNPIATLNGENFARIWNSCYGQGNNKIYGAPPQKDFSLFWNQGEPGGQSNGIAYNGSSSWRGQEA